MTFNSYVTRIWFNVGPDGDSSWKGMLYLILAIGLIFGGGLLGAKLDEMAKKDLTKQSSVVESQHD